MAVREKRKTELNLLIDKIDIIIRLLVLQIKGDSSDSDMVRKLEKGKFKPAEIGRMLGISTRSVTSRITQEKKSKAKGKKK